MRVPPEAPVQVNANEDGDGIFDKEFEHPAYAMIGAHRVQGEARLVGSDLKHQHFIILEIKPAKRYRTLSRDWFMSKMMPYVKVALSENQWAQFVSTLNMGDGVPCTLMSAPVPGSKYRDVPGVIEESNHDVAKREVDQKVARIAKHLGDSVQLIANMLKKPSVSKKDLTEVANEISRAHTQVAANLEFLVDSHKRMMDKNVAAAKSEIEGYTAHRAMSLGLEAMRGPQLPEQIEGKVGQVKEED